MKVNILTLFGISIGTLFCIIAQPSNLDNYFTLWVGGTTALACSCIITYVGKVS